MQSSSISEKPFSMGILPCISRFKCQAKQNYPTVLASVSSDHLALFAGKQFEAGVLFYSGQQILPFTYQDRTFFALPIGLLST